MSNALLLLASLWAMFGNPPREAKPWTYYFWQNSLTDRETITEEIADITKAVRAGASSCRLTIRYTNNWYNRFVGDMFLPEDKRVLASNVRAWAKKRGKDKVRPWWSAPTVFSGFCQSDPLQPSGVLGPVKVIHK